MTKKHTFFVKHLSTKNDKNTHSHIKDIQDCTKDSLDISKTMFWKKIHNKINKIGNIFHYLFVCWEIVIRQKKVVFWFLLENKCFKHEIIIEQITYRK